MIEAALVAVVNELELARPRVILLMLLNHLAAFGIINQILWGGVTGLGQMGIRGTVLQWDSFYLTS